MPLKPSEFIREMQLFGLGFSSDDWNILISQLQKHISHPLNTKLYEVSNSAETKNWLKDSENISSEILNHNPDWLFFSSIKFESAKHWLELLDNLQINSAKGINLVMVIKSIEDELYSILTLNPIFELINKMRFKISAKELLLNHHIPRFPRIELNGYFQSIEYISDSGSVLKNNLEEIPLNTLIPFKNIRKFHTNQDQLSPDNSIKMIMREQSKISDPKQVVGILRENKGCYLFPGIPFNSIKNITFDKMSIGHLIKLDECSLNNPPFKRLILELLKENVGINKKKNVKVKKSTLQILCLCKYSIINSLLTKLLKEIGNVKLVTVEEINPEDDYLKDFDVLLKLQDCKFIDFEGQILDWSKEFDLILEPLSQFVLLNDIESKIKKKPLRLQKTELMDLKEKLLKNEKAAETINMHAERDHLLYSQEYDVLKKLESLVVLLSDALSTSTKWVNAEKNAHKIKLQRALLICEDENDASEMNFKLTQVERKLWFNPFSIQKSEDLVQLKSKIFRSYFNPCSLIIKPAALKHLKKICIDTKQECKNAEKAFKNQKEIVKKTKLELKLIQIKKNNLALSWLENNLKKILFRDLKLLKFDSGILE